MADPRDLDSKVLLVVMGLGVWAFGGWGVTLAWPAGIIDLPIASLTLGMLLQGAAAVVLALATFGIWMMFVSVAFE